MNSPDLVTKNFFNRQKIKNPPVDIIDTRVWYNYLKALYPETHSEPLILPSHCNFMNSPITLGKLINSLNNCKINKAPGPDEISNEFLKLLPDNWLMYSLSFFNNIIQQQKIPPNWAKITIKMIHKKGDKENPDNYRPIFLVNTSLKLFTQILLSRLMNWIESKNLLPEWQSGFRKTRSCMDNIFFLTSAIQIKLRNPGGRLLALFVDFRKAFDSLNHNLLWKKLSDIKLIISLLIS